MESTLTFTNEEILFIFNILLQSSTQEYVESLLEAHNELVHLHPAKSLTLEEFAELKDKLFTYLFGDDHDDS